MEASPFGSDGALDPDLSEEVGGFDSAVPTRAYSHERVVGLGGSAGSIPALQQFFQAMPIDSGMAFVVVLHQSPEHVSVLSEILQRATSMHVGLAVDSERVVANRGYVTPPAKQLSMADGRLRLTDLPREEGRRTAVDLFFRSLADTHGPNAVAIVLSGSNGDGAIGIKRIKERGGLTIAQDPEASEHAGMPRAAIATTMVDWVLQADGMPARLVEYQARERRLQIPPENGANPAAPSPAASPDHETALRDVLAFVRTSTGRDFSYYKRATIVRRIARRMQVNEIDHLVGYLAFLRTHPGEAGALLRDLLISVTNFFRDRQAFDALEELIPELFKNKTASDTIRVWVPACATGEEAYSIAMLLSEHAAKLEAPPTLQVFATDLDDDVLAEARNGVYPEAIATDVSAERLRRFFVKEHHGYRVRRELRELLLFAAHDVLKDSPFSRLDLVSCRNLLIYLNRGAQRRAFDIFILLCASTASCFSAPRSRATTPASSSFPSIKSIASMRHAARPAPRCRVRPAPGTLARSLALHDRFEHHVGVVGKHAASAAALGGSTLGTLDLSWSELHLKLVERFGPPSLLVNGEHQIVHLSESAAPFLQFAGGEPSTSLLRVVHPGLRVELRATLFRARQSGETATAQGVVVDFGEQPRLVDIRVSPASDLAPDFFWSCSMCAAR